MFAGPTGIFIYRQDGSSFSQAEKAGRRILLAETPDFRLRAETDSFAGLFDSELAVYAVGHLGAVPEPPGLSSSLKESYWETEGCRSYEEYKKKYGSRNRYREFYEKMLHPTLQETDGKECMSFYNIGTEQDGDMELKCVFFQIRDAGFSQTEIGRRMIDRIYDFFYSKKVLQASYGASLLYDEDETPHLLSLCLTDRKGNIIRDYTRHQYGKIITR